MNIGKTLGKFFGRSKKKDGPADEESGFHETVNIGDVCSKEKLHEDIESNQKEFNSLGIGDCLNEKYINNQPSGNEVRGKSLESSKGFLHEETKRNERDISSMRVGGNFHFENDSNDLPSANEVKRRLLEADRVHKFWKLRRRFKMAGRELTEEILQIEIDKTGPHKWDTFINKPPMERYILMNEYIRKLAAKEAKESGHFGIVTSVTTERNLSKLHKKLRLDFSMNSNGEPSNISLGEDSSEEETFDEDLHEPSFQWKSMSLFQSTDVSKYSTNDSLMQLKQLYTEKNLQYVTPEPSVNILEELHKDESSESNYLHSNSSVCSESDVREAEELCSSESKQYYSASSTNEPLSEYSTDDSDQEQIPRVIFNASNISDRFKEKFKQESDEEQA